MFLPALASFPLLLLPGFLFLRSLFLFQLLLAVLGLAGSALLLGLPLFRFEGTLLSLCFLPYAVFFLSLFLQLFLSALLLRLGLGFLGSSLRFG
jgi:hypothetical protein